MRAPPARRAQLGFTLIEVLVALALMALVSLISWRGLASVSSARDWIESQAEDTDAIVRSLGQLGRDVELSYDGPVFDPVGGDTVALSAGVRLLRPPSGGAVLEILRPHPDSPGLWQRVHWRVRPDGLWRASGAASARGPLPPVGDGALLLPGVRGMTLRVWIPGTGWAEAARAASATAATGLEVTVQRGDAQAPQRYSRVMELP